MNVLIIGQPGALTARLTERLCGEGHRVSLLTGSGQRTKRGPGAFEHYDLPYDSPSLPEVFDSVMPDTAMFMGAYDGRFAALPPERAGAGLIAALANALAAFARLGRGRFVFLSSEAVFCGGAALTEEVQPDATAGFTLALRQAEALCDSFRVNRGLDMMILRLGGCPGATGLSEDVLTRMAREALTSGWIGVGAGRAAALGEADAARMIAAAALAGTGHHALYHLAGPQYDEKALAEAVRRALTRVDAARSVRLRAAKDQSARPLLVARRFEADFGPVQFTPPEDIAAGLIRRMLSHPGEFGLKQTARPTLASRLRAGNWLLRALVPTLENIAVFILAFLLADWTASSPHLAALRPYALYVLLFAALYGQRQGALSALLAAAGWLARQCGLRGGAAALGDAGTWLTLVQLFLLALAVGGLRDRLDAQKAQSAGEQASLREAQQDLRAVSESNRRARGALQTQLINQTDSLGQLYEMTAALDADDPDEVLRRAAAMLCQVMGTEDAAVYRVGAHSQARLAAASSEYARRLGHDVSLPALEALHADIAARRVFINRQLTPSLPSMAWRAGEDGDAQLLLAVWRLPLDKLTLGQADRLTVAGRLIQRAEARALRLQSALNAAETQKPGRG